MSVRIVLWLVLFAGACQSAPTFEPVASPAKPDVEAQTERPQTVTKSETEPPLAEPAAPISSKATVVEAPASRDLCAGPCKSSGRCKLVDGECRVGGDEDCAQSRDCARYGACADQGGQCWAGRQEHCATSELCAKRGRCDFVGGGMCGTFCSNENALLRRDVEEDTTCFRDPEIPCADSIACRKHGLCGEYGKNGVLCELNDVGCAAKPACAARGECAATRGSARCIPNDDDHCKASAACRDEGRCILFGAECITSEYAKATCGEGWIVRDGHCVRPPGYDCDEECRTENACEARSFPAGYVMCIQTAEFCRSQPACKQQGICKVNVKSWVEYNKCGDRDNQCGEWTYGGCVKSEDDCAKSVGCGKFGNCSAATPSHYCRPTRAEHCQQSEICKREGQCRLLDESSYFICGD